MPSLVEIGPCLLYTSDAADDMQCVDLGGRRIIKKTSFFPAEDGIRDVERSRGLGDVYKRQALHLNKLESSLPKNALFQVWLKLAQWFWRR